LVSHYNLYLFSYTIELLNKDINMTTLLRKYLSISRYVQANCPSRIAPPQVDPVQ
jgi:hypothetical protein